MTRPEDPRDEDRELEAFGAALRKAAAPPEFAPGFEQRVLQRVTSGTTQIESIERSLVRHFRRHLVPVAVAATIAAAVLNVRATADSALPAWERLLGWQATQTTTLDLYSLYVSQP